VADQPVRLEFRVTARRSGATILLLDRSTRGGVRLRRVRFRPSRRALGNVRTLKLRVLAVNATGARTSVRKTIRVR
jgi:hypothetical protein